MKALAERIESVKTKETLGEKTENVGARTPVVVDKSPVKKKVRIVKKIVKKKVIKKVPKRVLVSPNCNDTEKVASPNPNDNAPMEFESSVPLEIEKPNVVVDDFREAENMKGVEVSDRENGVHLVENDYSRRDESEMSGLITASLLCDQHQIELQDSDQKLIESQDIDQNQINLEKNGQNQIELEDCDRNQMKLQDSQRNQIELQESYQNQTKLEDSDQNRIKLHDSDIHNQIELQDNYQNQTKLEDSDQNRIELQDSDLHNQTELQDNEHDINNMDLEEHKVSELVSNSETDSLKSQEISSGKKVSSGETVASWWHTKQRTKIFIHGLNNETKEEDIKKVFEKVGEVVEVKIITNFRSGKSRGFGFIRYASAEPANLALTKCRHVEICGSTCHTASVEGNDTILLNNIDKKWNNENVLSLLHKIGIMKIDEVSVVPDPENTELNRGFAFLEFVTSRDAQMAYRKLQIKNIFGEYSNIKAVWADSLTHDPVEEEVHIVKSVYAERIPSSWNEKEVKAYFKIFGEIESIALAKNLRSTQRNDFAFINFKTREAALSCIEALTHKKSTGYNDPTAHLKVSLAKSVPKFKSTKTISESTVPEVSKFNQKPIQSRPPQIRYQNTPQSRQFQPFLDVYNPQKPNNVKISSVGSRHNAGSSTTDELVQLLREQASWKLGGPTSTAGMNTNPFRGEQQLLIEQGSKSLYHDPQTYHQNHLQIPYPTHLRPRVTSSLPHYDQQRAHFTPGLSNRVEPNPRFFFQTDRTTYPGSSNVYRRMR